MSGPLFDKYNRRCCRRPCENDNVVLAVNPLIFRSDVCMVVPAVNFGLELRIRKPLVVPY